VDAKPPPSPHEIAEHRSWRRWVIGSLIVMLLLLTPIAGLHLYDASLVAEANRLIAELDRTEPGWRQPVAPAAPLPADRDSLVAIRRVTELLPKHWAKEVDENSNSMIGREFCPAPCMLPKRDADDLAAVLKRADAALPFALTIKDLPDGSPVTKPGDLLDTTDAHLAQQVGELLDYAIYDHLQHKDVAGAWEACRAHANLGKPFGQGALIAGLIRMALTAVANTGIERTLAHDEVSEADLATMQKSIAEEAKVDYFFPYLPGECAYWLKTCDDAIADPAKAMKAFGEFNKDKIGWWGQLNERFPRPMFLRSKIETVERMKAVHRLQPLRGFDRYEAMGRLDREFGPPAKDGTQRLTWDMSAVLIDARSERGLLARLGCAEVALAAERFRLKFGRWPANASELVDKGLLTRIPEDPFDGNPLRMRLFAHGLVVYAVGKKKDYDGTDWDNFDDLETRFREGPEFRLWNPERRHQPPIPPRKKVDGE
jgi:hypothetical protein